MIQNIIPRVMIPNSFERREKIKKIILSIICLLVLGFWMKNKRDKNMKHEKRASDKPEIYVTDSV